MKRTARAECLSLALVSFSAAAASAASDVEAADQLFEAGEFHQAAKFYLEAVRKEPRLDHADRALNKAAVCYENLHEFNDALRLYQRIVDEYPASALADGALFRLGVDAENTYDFERAAMKYRQLLLQFPNSPYAETAGFNIPRLLEAQRNLRQAADAYVDFAKRNPRSDEAANSLYRAGLSYEKLHEYALQISALNMFLQRAGSAETLELTVEAHWRIGEAFRELGSERKAEAEFAETVKAFDRLRLDPGKNPIAAEAVASAHAAQPKAPSNVSAKIDAALKRHEREHWLEKATRQQQRLPALPNNPVGDFPERD